MARRPELTRFRSGWKDPFWLSVGLIALGIVLLIGGPSWGGSWIQIAGTALLTTGLTVVVGTFTGSEAARSQFEQEANIRRRNELYRPLYSQILRLRDLLGNVEQKSQPMPQSICTGDSQPPPGFVPGNMGPVVTLWRDFQKDARCDEFMHSTQMNLDQLVALAETYNRAMVAAMAVAQTTLTDEIAVAVQRIRASPEYKGWEQDGRKRDQWHYRVSEIEPEGLAMAWLHGVNVNGSDTLGWLLTSVPKQAAAFPTYLQSLGATSPPIPGIELEGICSALCTTAQADDSFKDVRKSMRDVYKKLSSVERTLRAGLDEIRNRYEGGPPRL